MQDSRQLMPTYLQDESFYMVADGEEIQIAPIEDDEINQCFTDANIDFGKGPDFGR